MFFGKKTTDPAAPKPPGLSQTLRAFSGTLLAALHTRLDLATLELEEQGVAALKLALLSLAAIICLSIAFVFLNVLLIVALWDHNELVISLICVVYLLAAIIFGALARQLVTTWPKFLGQSMHELKRDAETLKTQFQPEVKS